MELLLIQYDPLYLNLTTNHQSAARRLFEESLESSHETEKVHLLATAPGNNVGLIPDPVKQGKTWLNCLEGLLNTPRKINGWNLRIPAPWKRKIIFQTIIFRFQLLIFRGVVSRNNQVDSSNDFT